MSNGYGTWYHTAEGPMAGSMQLLHQIHVAAGDRSGAASTEVRDLRLARIVLCATAVMLLAFTYVLTLAGGNDLIVVWRELTLAGLQVVVLAASFFLPTVRRFIGTYIRVFCYLTAGLFIALAASSGFGSNLAVGLLFVIPGLGAAYGTVTRDTWSIATFFGVSTLGASMASLLVTGPTANALLFIVSLSCISTLTLFVAVGWVGARERCRASEERFRAVVEQASDGIFLLDPDTMHLMDANRAFRAMLGASRSQLRTIRLADVLEPVRGEALTLDADRFHGARHQECLLRRSDGTTLHVDLKLDKIRYPGGELLSGVVHDVSSHKEHEERLLKAKEDAEEIARFKSTLLSNMSHEIRTPLSSILGWTAVLSTEVPEGQRELIDLIEQSGKRLHNTLDSVLELAHLQANVKQLYPVRFDLTEAVRQAAEWARGDVRGKGLSLELHVPAEAITVESDPACLRRVLTHLLDNAIKFTRTGCISVSVNRLGDEVAIEIADTGVGISQTFLPSVFDEFKQESGGLRRAHEGSGLGLSLVRRLTELLGGRVDVTSQRDVGTTFTVYLPATSAVMRRLDTRSNAA